MLHTEIHAMDRKKNPTYLHIKSKTTHERSSRSKEVQTLRIKPYKFSTLMKGKEK